MSATVRTAKKLLLGREISHMIEKAGVSQTDAANLIETSQPRIAGLISGGGNISPGDLVLLATKLGFTDDGYQEALRELRRDNHKRGFWSTGHNRAYSEDLRLLIDLEKHADQIRSVEAEIMPGLLQCEAYVRAQYAGEPQRDGLTIDDLVRARLARQEILDKPEPPTVQFVMSESCLRRVWGDGAVMREQIEHVIALSNRKNVMVQVVPFVAPLGRRATIGNRFVLLRVPSPGAAGPLELAYTEGEGEIRYLDDKNALAAHDAAWARLTSAALSFEDSRKFMKQLAREFKE
jgi:predicted XRE-type DNA-binding protein